MFDYTISVRTIFYGALVCALVWIHQRLSRQEELLGLYHASTDSARAYNFESHKSIWVAINRLQEGKQPGA